MNHLPDRPLVVKCTFDKWHKRITFSSARNCSYDLLRRKVEQGFALSASSYAITYKDDDGEITNISTNDDLVEAIHYFQAGDDAPSSSAASILSGRSFGARKITLRVVITVDYDGPSLSDTSSLASLDDFKARNNSQQSFSIPSAPIEVDDDSVTVSSRDPGLFAAGNTRTPIPDRPSISKQQSLQMFKPLGDEVPSSQLMKSTNGTLHHEDPLDIDSEIRAVSERFPSDPSSVFQRLKLSEALADDGSSIDIDHLAASERGAAWLRDQNERAIRSKIGALREPSESDLLSLTPDDSLDGDLALERDPRGRYYYSYTSGSSASQAQGSMYDDGQQSNAEEDIEVHAYGVRPRPTSMHLNWLASQRIQADATDVLSESVPNEEADLPLFELDRPLLPVRGPPEDIATDCSNCGVLLDAIRYVCSTCGPRSPIGTSSDINRETDDSPTTAYSYPPDRHPFFLSPNSSSSQTLIASSSSSCDKPLPSLPSSLPSSLCSVFRSSQKQLKLSSTPSPTKKPNGYELCAMCLETVGINHAVEAGLAMPRTSPVFCNSPFMHDDPQIASQWRRAAPKKGKMRHAYQEKAWGQNGWEDVVLDETQVSKCSTCSAVTERMRYKCISCEKLFLCRACYSQVHELHPSHAFCIVPDRPIEMFIDDNYLAATSETNEELSLIHPGVKCAHCLLDIVGARFHCAICDSVDICSNCESAGLPGNLDSSDDGHNSSHILIKIPYPLENTELRNASRHALHLWKGRDAANVAFGSGGVKDGSEVSSYAQTLIGNGSRHRIDPSDHDLRCSGCSRLISGVRYQCGRCPSKPTAYNLCSSCEPRSYLIHDPMHIFIKFPRPVHRPVEELYPILPPLYKIPTGPPANAQSTDPRAYLTSLVHSSALCDRCMTPIEGEWFRCCYCSRDLCDACEAVDTHNDTHVFIVLKSAVDMQSFKHFASVDSHAPSLPIIPYPVYR